MNSTQIELCWFLSVRVKHASVRDLIKWFKSVVPNLFNVTTPVKKYAN